jgi:hypothetical protein
MNHERPNKALQPTRESRAAERQRSAWEGKRMIPGHWRFRLVGVAFALGVAAVGAHAQTCIPSTSPCQTCPAPAPCVPSAISCGSTGFGSCPAGQTCFSTSTTSCTGGFAQVTVSTETVFGPINICIGPNRTVGCLVPAGTTHINTNTTTIAASPHAAPSLSWSGLGVLALSLGGLAVRRLSRVVNSAHSEA